MFPRRAHPLLLRSPPQSDSQSQSSGSQSPLLTLSCDNLLEAIRSAPKGSAQGVIGWRYEHLSYFIPRDSSAQVRILRIATCLVRGDAPVGFISLLAEGRCFVLNKNARGTEVRPIMVGDVLCFRLCGAASGTIKYQSAHFDKKLKEAWELSQAVEGYGDPQGAHLLFRFCVLLKLIYLTRIIGDVITLGEWSQVDRELGESWARIMGMTEQEWAHGEVRCQAYLPQYQGGLGLTCFRATATAGLLGSYGVTLSTVIERLTNQSFLGPSQSPDRDAFFALPWLQVSKREYERAESATESVNLKAHHPLC
eukprot:Cvel_19417.t2-p1 / transcript=Cvel_19417.t2 / gene=Cvel_19417 / organism=Chromera_velia_CCMP2878 / gene_product=hypothetical protein / transcript_product=hypothetical protein / location=Cvel_scaffold1672:17790-19403(+) / protein_length=308 / sequence_SO=supercontig / SO=protein_coding / is_pseudo=false